MQRTREFVSGMMQTDFQVAVMRAHLPGFRYEKHARVRVLTKPRPAGSERFRTGWSRNAHPARRGFESTILAESIKTL